MPNLAFPQLSSGAMAQYPIRKTTARRTVKNILADDSFVVSADPAAGRLIWGLSYSDLSTADMRALQRHFENCHGPLRAFTFLDPTDNLLQNSADLAASVWQIPAGLRVETGLQDPNGGSQAFRVTNLAAAALEMGQLVPAPSNYQYCFSAYLSSDSTSTVELIRRGADGISQSTPIVLTRAWKRRVSSGRLASSGTTIWAAIRLAAGQSVLLFGPQLEPQHAPSAFRPTFTRAGVYPSAHWAIQELIFTPEALNLFSTSFNIETTIWT